jgi:hypothetical protein
MSEIRTGVRPSARRHKQHFIGALAADEPDERSRVGSLDNLQLRDTPGLGWRTLSHSGSPALSCSHPDDVIGGGRVELLDLMTCGNPSIWRYRKRDAALRVHLAEDSSGALH